MSLTTLLIGIVAFLVVVIIGMLIGFIVREMSFSRQLDAIRQILVMNAETSNQIVELVEASLSTVTANREADAASSAGVLERIRDLTQSINQSVIPLMNRIDGLLSQKTVQNYIAQGSGQVNQGHVSNPETR